MTSPSATGTAAPRRPARSEHRITDDAVPVEVHLRTIELKNDERDRAYRDGYSTGFIDGLEAGLRATLADAAAALGAAA